MSKFIIDNRTDLTDIEVMEMICTVIKLGRISNNGKQYCYGTTIDYGESIYSIWTNLNKKSDRFIITKRIK